MILGYELPVEMPTMDIYSTDLMKAYIAGVKQLYDDARDDYKDFLKTYGDFYSNVPGATEAYYLLGPGRAMNFMNQMYANGIDPLRSSEGRAAVALLIASTNTAAMKLLEALKLNYDTYLKALTSMIASGKTNMDFENWRKLQLGLDKWLPVLKDVNGNIIAVNPWTRVAPDEFTNLHDLTVSEYAKFLPIEDLGPSETHPGYRKIGVSKEHRDMANQAALTSLYTDPTGSGAYHIYLAERYIKNKAAINGIKLSPEELKRLTMAEVSKRIDEQNPTLETEQIDEAWKLQLQYRNQLNLIGARTKAAYNSKVLWANDPKNPANRLPIIENGGPSIARDLYLGGVAKILNISKEQLISNPEVLNAASAVLYDYQKSIIQGTRPKSTKKVLDKDKGIKTVVTRGNYDWGKILRSMTTSANSIDIMNYARLLPLKEKITGTTSTKTYDDKFEYFSELENRLYSPAEVVTTSAGYGAKAHDSANIKAIAKNSTNIQIAKDNNIVVRLGKDGQIKTFAKIYITDKNQKRHLAYFDLNINSERKLGGLYESLSSLNVNRVQPIAFEADTENQRMYSDAAATQKYTGKSQKDENVWPYDVNGAYDDFDDIIYDYDEEE